MTLRQDCELWVTFDSEDVDPNRGIVRDRSGKGRTLSASGGPTYGQSSPVGEAVAFDGMDDFFAAGIVNGLQEQTMAALVRFDDLSTPRTIISNGGTGSAGGFTFLADGTDIKFYFEDGNDNNPIVSFANTETGVYYFAIAQWDGQKIKVYVDGELKEQKSVSAHDSGTESTLIGLGARNNRFPMSGDIAFVGRWSRALSDAEIEELTRMTDRMVSKL